MERGEGDVALLLPAHTSGLPLTAPALLTNPTHLPPMRLRPSSTMTLRPVFLETRDWAAFMPLMPALQTRFFRRFLVSFLVS